MCIGMFAIKNSQAQVSVSVNIGTQPLWGPANYDYVEYYYLPEADIYYYVPTSQYIYFSGGRWITVSYLPAHYHIDLYRTYKVVINEPRPYMNHHVYRDRYSRYKHSYNKQAPLRDYHGGGGKSSGKQPGNHQGSKGQGSKGNTQKKGPRPK